MGCKEKATNRQKITENTRPVRGKRFSGLLKQKLPCTKMMGREKYEEEKEHLLIGRLHHVPNMVEVCYVYEQMWKLTEHLSGVDWIVHCNTACSNSAKWWDCTSYCSWIIDCQQSKFFS